MTTASHSTTPRRDFSGDVRLLRIAALAALIGAFSTVAARVLLTMIRFFTDLFFYGKFSIAELSPADNTLGPWVIVVPVLGGLVIGLIARFGTEQVRGHGIPEAIEAILFKRSAMSPKVAVLKPLASGIAIGSGGPFGAEGPIIMTGGAIGSLLAQHFHLTGGERKSLLVAGAVSGMTAVFGTPVAAVLRPSSCCCSSCARAACCRWRRRAPWPASCARSRSAPACCSRCRPRPSNRSPSSPASWPASPAARWRG